jgi:hypothetical protein
MFSGLITAITANFKTKLLALVIALGIWFYASSQLTERTVVPIQVELTPPEGYEMVYTNTREVDATVSGPASAIEALQRASRTRPPKVRHQLSEADVMGDSPGLNKVTVDLQADWIDWRVESWQSNRLRIHVLDPQAVTLVAEPVVEEVVSVEIPAAIRLQEDGRLDWTPKQVTVKGPAAVVRNMASIGLAEGQNLFDVGRRAVEKTLQRRRTVLLDGERIQVPIQADPARVDVMQVQAPPENEQDEIFEDVPIRLLVPIDFPFVARIAEDQPRTATVRVRAMPEQLSRLRRKMDATTAEADRTAITAYVDLGNPPEDISPGETYNELVRVRLPNGVSASEVSVPDPDNPNVTLELTIVLTAKPPAAP